MPLSLELLQYVLAKPSMQHRSPINLKRNHRSIPYSARIAHSSTHLGMSIALPKSLSAKVVWRKDIGKPSFIPARLTSPLVQWTANQTVCLVSLERRGRRLTSKESTLRNHHMMRSSYMMFMHPTPMRHTQLFAYLLLLATNEWPLSESKLNWGKQKCSTSVSPQTPLSQSHWQGRSSKWP